MDTVLRHVQDVEVTNRFGNMDAVLRRTQDAVTHYIINLDAVLRHTANQNLMPNLSGLFGIYWVNLQRDFVENSYSSIVIFSPGFKQLMQLSTNLFEISKIRANCWFASVLTLCYASRSVENA